MPKIRGVKPDYWTDEDISELSIPARLLFIGLWNYACDNGHLQDKSKQIKMRLLPGDDVNVAELLRELEGKSRIRRADGWIVIPNFAHHQKPDRRYWQTCDKAGCQRPERNSQPETRGAHHETTPGARGDHAWPPGDGDGDGDGELKVMVKGTAAKSRRQLPSDWAPNEAHRGFAASNDLNLSLQVEKFTDHHHAKGSTMKDWDAAFRTWLRNAVEWRKDAPSRPRVLPQAHELELPPDGLSPEQYAKWDADRRAKRLA